MKVTNDEIRDQLAKALDFYGSGQSKWPGMSYEEGVEAALRWILGDEPEGPMDQE